MIWFTVFGLIWALGYWGSVWVVWDVLFEKVGDLFWGVCAFGLGGGIRDVWFWGFSVHGFDRLGDWGWGICII